MLVIGDINNLIVKRKTDIGYMLETHDEEEVFLHNNESNHAKLNEGDLVDAFLYFDFKGRLAATLHKPFITINNPGFLKVVSVNPDLGVFLNNNISKDILVSKDYLPFSKESWPQVGETLYVLLKVKSKMTARIYPKGELINNKDVTLTINETYDAYVHHLNEAGITLLTNDLNVIFVHKHNLRGNYHVGQKVSVKITNFNGKNYNGSLVSQKEDQMYDDANHILSYLIKNDGIMYLNANSSANDIERELGLSKKAFKRGIGNLYKQRLIDFVNDKTILVKKEEEKNE